MDKSKLSIIRTYIILFIVMVISAFAIFLTYQEYIFVSRISLGQILCSQIRNAQLLYYSQNGKFITLDKVFFNEDLNIDARNNPYFYTFSTYSVGTDKQGVTVFGSDSMKDYEIVLHFNSRDQKTTNIKDLDIKVIKNRNNK